MTTRRPRVGRAVLTHALSGRRRGRGARALERRGGGGGARAGRRRRRASRRSRGADAAAAARAGSAPTFPSLAARVGGGGGSTETASPDPYIQYLGWGNCTQNCGGDDLTFPNVVRSRDGLLEYTLKVRPARFFGPVSYNVRAYDGSTPGPTFYVRKGDRVVITLQNELEFPTQADVTWSDEDYTVITATGTCEPYSQPNVTSLHFHGLLVKILGQGDSPFRMASPNEAITTTHHRGRPPRRHLLVRARARADARRRPASLARARPLSTPTPPPRPRTLFPGVGAQVPLALPSSHSLQTAGLMGGAFIVEDDDGEDTSTTTNPPTTPTTAPLATTRTTRPRARAAAAAAAWRPPTTAATTATTAPTSTRARRSSGQSVGGGAAAAPRRARPRGAAGRSSRPRSRTTVTPRRSSCCSCSG